MLLMFDVSIVDSDDSVCDYDIDIMIIALILIAFYVRCSFCCV